MHGVSYSVDGKRLYIPMHHGLAVYNGSQWTKVPGPEHDYMGFAVTRQFWYSSGHPMPGSPLKNPLGLIKSKDQGQTWELLGLSGEADFHLMATSYQTNTVYVVNPSPNSRMPQPGLYYTTNDGKQWHVAKSTGLVGNLVSLAVHPAQEKVVAAGTRSGVFLSQDAGTNFQPLVDGLPALALCFTFDGQHLWISSFDSGKPTLTQLQWQTGQQEACRAPPWSRMWSPIWHKALSMPRHGLLPRTNATCMSHLITARRGSRSRQKVRRADTSHAVATPGRYSVRALGTTRTILRSRACPRRATIS